MNDQRFFDLAMKNIARQATDAEQAELDALLASHPELKAELEKLRTDARLAREVLPLAAAAESSTGQFPAYARERLQTKVRQTLGDAHATAQRSGWNLKWLMGFAASVAVILVLVFPLLKPTAPVIQVAMLDSTGAVRGAESDEAKIIQGEWKGSIVQTFAQSAELEAWQTVWPDGSKPAVKVIYDRTAGELKVIIRSKGKTTTQSFAVEKDLAAALQQVKAYLAERAKR